MTNSDHDKTLRKFRRERAVGRLLNPAVQGLSKLGLRTAMATELETVGRKTGQVRRVPVSVQFDHDGAWVICQHGTRVADLVLVAPGSIPITTSGKIRRITCAQLYRDNQLARIG